MKPKQLSFTQNALYNTVGSLLSGFCLWLTTLIVVRLSADYANAGVWQLSISVTNIFAMVATFNLSAYLVSDTRDEYTSGQYVGTQLIACAASVLLCVGYSVLCKYRGEQLLSIVLYMLCLAFNALSLLLLGFCQRNYRMDYAGISNALRGVLGLLAFALLLRLTDHVYLAAAGMACASLAVLLFYDRRNARQFASLRPDICVRDRSLLRVCLPIVVASAAFISVATVPRQFLQSLCGEEALGHYATVATPVVVVQTLALSVFAPLLRDLALYYQQKEFGKIFCVLKKLLLAVAALAVCALLGCRLLGELLWTTVYGEGIRPYCYLLYGVAGCTVLFVLCQIGVNLLIIMRKTRALLFFSVLGLLAAAISGKILITAASLNGVSWATMLGYAVYLIPCTLYLLRHLKHGSNSPAL